jgi:hypothetical protein
MQYQTLRSVSDNHLSVVCRDGDKRKASPEVPGAPSAGARCGPAVCHSGCIGTRAQETDFAQPVSSSACPNWALTSLSRAFNSGGRDLGDEMFSRQPHVRDDDETISADEAFRWTEDEVVTERRRNRVRRKRIGLSFVGALGLTALIVGVKVSMGLH